MTMSKLILSQDDCAPDSLEVFNEEFEKLTGISRSEFIKKSNYVEENRGITNSYIYGVHKLSISADDPYWKLYNISGKNHNLF
jgi:hypothetical protein